MELSPPPEATSCSATQKFPNILWDHKVHYCVHKSLPLIPILGQINPVHDTPSYFSKIHLSITSDLHLVLPSDLFPSRFTTKILYAFRFSPCMLHSLPISPSLTSIIPIICGQKYRLWRSLCNFFQPSLISSLFGPNILPSTPVFQIFSFCSRNVC
jgi:hypothetical protein